MALFPSTPASARHAAHTAAHEAAPWVQRLARLGYGAKGVVYMIIGGLAVQAALSPTERPEGSEGALSAILRQPFGRVLLGIVAVGLVGYVLWRLVQAFRDPDREGSDAKGLAKRAGFLLSGLLYAAVALEAVRLSTGWGGGGGSGGGGEGNADHWTAMVMSQPLGRWAIGVVGAGVILFGLVEFYRAARAELAKRLNLSGLREAAREQIIRFGRLGLAARGVVFLVIGWFLIQAALQYDPQEARGLAGALGTLQRQPYGPYLLGGVAVGLIAYGAFQLVKARYRVIRAD